MFDNIGKDLDEQANRRRAESVLYTTLIVGAAVGIFLYLTARVAVQVVEDFADLAMVEIETTDEQIASAAPPPPPPPLKGEASDEEDDAEFEPDEVVEEVVELQKVVERQIVKAKGPKGDPDGDELGDPDGKAWGQRGGNRNSNCGPNDNCTGLGMMVDYKDLRPKTLVSPEYPSKAKSLNLGDVSCIVTVAITDKGRPETVRVTKCPAVFHPEVKRAMFKSSWYPYKAGNVKQAVHFTLAIKFRMT